MRVKAWAGAALLLTTAALSGCNNSIKEQNALLQDEVTALRDQLAQRNDALDSANEDLRQRQLRIAQLERDLRESQQEPEVQPADSGFGGIQGVTGSVSAGEVTATVEGDVLFPSGQTTLRNEAKRSLDQVASVLNGQYAGRPIRIVGHTDTDPIRVSGHKSNYHLGFERAYAVREYLTSRGVSAGRISLASFGPDKPMGSKARSRRVEIVVIMQ